MPYEDGTGPWWGRGPLTGRGLGPCGRGLGFRRGSSRGFGRGFGYGRSGFGTRALTKEEEKEILKAEKEALEKDLKDIQKRLEEIK